MEQESERTYICIDLKSFYASVECVERGLDPFRTDLVVADPDRSRSTICLAITPAMKSKGVRNRCRMHEIPPKMQYIIAKPRMQLYLEYSARIYGVYLRFIAAEDIHIYSVDECFMDVTTYLKLYRIEAKEMAERLMAAVFAETGITASAGIGTNLYLAKIAMDIIAKRTPDHIGILDVKSYRKQLWGHRPLQDFWMVGSGTVRRLSEYGIYTMGDIARASLTSEKRLYKLFGVHAELLIDHAWGVESCRMEDIRNYHTKDHSLSHSQILMRNYSFEEARVIVKEMADLLSLELVGKKLAASSLTVVISYDHHYELPHSAGTAGFGSLTNSSRRIIAAADQVYCHVTDRFTGIRRISISANKVQQEEYMQFDLFMPPEEAVRERQLQESLLKIRNRFGKNAVVRGLNLTECSTFMERNRQIGGHSA